MIWQCKVLFNLIHPCVQYTGNVSLMILDKNKWQHVRIIDYWVQVCVFLMPYCNLAKIVKCQNNIRFPLHVLLFNMRQFTLFKLNTFKRSFKQVERLFKTKRKYFEEVYWKELIFRNLIQWTFLCPVCVQCDAGESNPCIHPALRSLCSFTHTPDSRRRKAETFEGSASVGSCGMQLFFLASFSRVLSRTYST